MRTWLPEIIDTLIGAPSPRHASLRDLRGLTLISGVTGSGKTTTARLFAEQLSAQRTTVLAVDAKGDFAGISQHRAPASFHEPPPPVRLWDPAGRLGRRFDPLNGAREVLTSRPTSGGGLVHVLHGVKLIQDPQAYAQLICDLLSALAAMPAARGAAPRFALIIEEAHLVFRHLQAARHAAALQALARLKGDVVILIASDPAEVPEAMDALIDRRVQHSLWSLSDRTLARLSAAFAAEHQDDAGVRESVQSLGIGEVLVAASGAVPQQIQIPKPATATDPSHRESVDASIRSPRRRRPRRAAPPGLLSPLMGGAPGAPPSQTIG